MAYGMVVGFLFLEQCGLPSSLRKIGGLDGKKVNTHIPKVGLAYWQN